MWLHNEPARRTLKVLSGSISPVRIAATALRDIRDNVHRNLDDYSRDIISESSAHVITERDFPFSEFDDNLFFYNAENEHSINKTVRPHINRILTEYLILSRTSDRKEFSLTSYVSTIFEPKEYRANMLQTSVDVALNISYEETQQEIERLREELTRALANNRNHRQAGSSKILTENHENINNNSILVELMLSIRKMREQMKELHEYVDELREQVEESLASRANDSRMRRTYNDRGLAVTYGSNTWTDMAHQNK